MKQAFRKFDTAQTPYTPALSIVICVSIPPFFSILVLFTARQGKRHHTRFYPVEEGNADHNGNPRPGTVVDRGVTAIYHFDFFLQGEKSKFDSSSPVSF
jgi:eukaryotic translation initiation factor 2C